MTTPLRVPWSRWSAKQYILAALLGMLATVAVVASISISLAPAHIAFFVLEAKVTNSTPPDSKQLPHWYYNLTLEANNPSHRTSVLYGSLAVNIWRSETAWIPTDEVGTSAALSGWLWPGTSKSFNFSVERGQYDEETMTPAAKVANPPPPPPPPGSSSSSSRGVPRWPEYRVVVEAKVWFRFAGVPTLPYAVKVSCFPVNFLNRTGFPVKCTG